jgi:hypothetical protein
MLTTAELNAQLKLNKQKLKNIKLMDTIKTYHDAHHSLQATLEDSKAALCAANMALADAADKPEYINYDVIIDDWRRNEFGMQHHNVKKQTVLTPHFDDPHLWQNKPAVTLIADSQNTNNDGKWTIQKRPDCTNCTNYINWTDKHSLNHTGLATQ